VLSLIIAKIHAFVAAAFVAGISLSIVYVTMIVRRSSVPTGNASTTIALLFLALTAANTVGARCWIL
jgi:hypothetical protein